jgi:Holliday junction resolvase RusA-like endonuclease
MDGYARVVVKGSPISKSNFKLFNLNGRAILPMSSGKYHDRYAVYEEQIAYEAKVQNPSIILRESLIAVLKVYYKSVKRHPDTNNITKSIFDGIEKSGLIVNDAQVKRIILDEYYDKENPRFELELYAVSKFDLSYKVSRKALEDIPINYLPANRLSKAENSINNIISNNVNKTENIINNFENNIKAKSSSKKNNTDSKEVYCGICKRKVSKNEYVTGDKGKSIICKACLNKLI